MADDPILDAYDAGKPRPKLSVVGSEEHNAIPPLVLRPARLPDPESIPARQWLYGTSLLRGFVSVLVAPGGTGKSALAMAIGMEIATGKSFLGNHVFERANVAIFNLEDPMEELDRRVAALMIRHKLPRNELVGRLFLHDGEGRGLKLATLQSDGYSVAYPDEQALIEQIREHNIGLVICDPFAESHSLEENSNPHMVQAAAAWRRVARATNCAVLLVHHVRKGEATGIEAARGAKALTDSARVGLLLAAMTKDEAEGFGIDDDDRHQYVRLDNVKRNMAPPGRAAWLQLVQVNLGNAAPGYPNGDNVAAIAAWEPPSIWASTSDAEINAVLDRIDAGLQGGGRYTDTKRGAANNRWAGTVLVDCLGCTDKQAANTLATWLKTGLLIRSEYRDKQEGKDRIGLSINPVKRPGWGS